MAKQTSVKCAYELCRIGRVENSERMTETITSQSGKNTYKHFHPSCHVAHIKLKESRKIDLPELDSLYQTIKRIHNIPKETNVESSLMSRLQDVRDGTIRKGKEVVKRYKEGVPYHIMEDAYKLAENSIIYYRTGGKVFKNKEAELRYCFAIVLGKIDLALHRRKKSEKEAQNVEAILENKESIGAMSHVDTPNPIFKPKQKPKHDISDLLR